MCIRSQLYSTEIACLTILELHMSQMSLKRYENKISAYLHYMYARVSKVRISTLADHAHPHPRVSDSGVKPDPHPHPFFQTAVRKIPCCINSQ